MQRFAFTFAEFCMKLQAVAGYQCRDGFGIRGLEPVVKISASTFLRSRSLARMVSSSLLIVSQRGRSSGFGNVRMGGVFGTFPSIARCVVLLNNAESE